MNKIVNFFLLGITFFPIICFCQNGLNIEGFVPNLIPPSPNAYALGKYGQIPIGLYTGLVNFDLPLYTYKTNHLTVPISLQYSSNGIKVDQVESNVGLGWNLNAGGVITKFVRNRSDDLQACMYPAQEIFNVNNQAAIDFFDSVGNWNGDAEPDLFMFNFMGHSGEFVFDKDHNVVIMPLQDIKIEDYVEGSDDDGFTITCSDGIKYSFYSSEVVSSRLTGIEPPPEQSFLTNAWYLTKIIHPNGDTITFTYEHDGYWYYTSICETYTVLDPPGQAECEGITMENPGKSGPFLHRSTVAGLRLVKISSNNVANGEVDFFSNYVSPDVPGFNLIDSILVKNQYSNLIERFDFDYYSPKNKRVFLNGVKFKDVSKLYSFNYIGPDSLPERLSYAQDHWGYYNGVLNNVNFYPNLPDNAYFSNINGANKEPDSVFSKVGLLRKIRHFAILSG